jgi:hypothetical protein
MSGLELTQVVRDIIAAPVDLRERVRVLIQPTNAKELPGAGRAGE